jgi:hypothetical protein
VILTGAASATSEPEEEVEEERLVLTDGGSFLDAGSFVEHPNAGSFIEHDVPEEGEGNSEGSNTGEQEDQESFEDDGGKGHGRGYFYLMPLQPLGSIREYAA